MAILMTEQLAKQLIEHYENCIKMVDSSRSLKEAINLCILYCTKSGIALCATQQSGKYIYECDWVKEAESRNWSSYRKEIPDYCTTVDEIITALQTRVDILKTFKNENV
jgi:hypothetical protein